MTAPEPDPAATFRLDQEAAQEEEKTRDQAGWELNLRNGQAQASGLENNAALLKAKADFWTALSGLLWVAVLIVALIALGAGVEYVVGLFR